MVLRVSEVAALKVGDIDSSRTLIWVERNGLRTTPLCCRKAWQLFAPSPETCQSGFGHYGREANARSSVSMRESGRAAFHPTQSFIGDPANGRSRPSADSAGERLSQHHVERGEPLRAKEVLGVKISCPGVQSNFVDAL